MTTTTDKQYTVTFVADYGTITLTVATPWRVDDERTKADAITLAASIFHDHYGLDPWDIAGEITVNSWEG